MTTVILVKLGVNLIIIGLLVFALVKLLTLERVAMVLLLGFLLKISTSGESALLIHPRYFWLIDFSIIFTAIMLLTGKSNIRLGGWNKFFTFLLCIFLILAMRTDLEPLSSFANRDFGQSELLTSEQLSREKRLTNFTFDTQKLNLQDWVTRFSINPEPTKYIGEKIDVDGFYYLDEDGNSMIARYILSCCAADARLIGVWLAKPLDFPPNTWLNVEGELTTFNIGNLRTVAIDVKKAEKIETPKNPYVTN